MNVKMYTGVIPSASSFSVVTAGAVVVDVVDADIADVMSEVVDNVDRIDTGVFDEICFKNGLYCWSLY